MAITDMRPPQAGQDQASLGWGSTKGTPQEFSQYLSDAISWMDAHPDQTTAERFLLIYAWNEFGEGGYIAPTRGDPDGAFLKALKSDLSAGR